MVSKQILFSLTSAVLLFTLAGCTGEPDPTPTPTQSAQTVNPTAAPEVSSYKQLTTKDFPNGIRLTVYKVIDGFASQVQAETLGVEQNSPVTVLGYTLSNPTNQPVDVRNFTLTNGYFLDENLSNTFDVSSSSLHESLGLLSYPSDIFEAGAESWILNPNSSATWHADWIIPSSSSILKQNWFLNVDEFIGDTEFNLRD